MFDAGKGDAHEGVAPDTPESAVPTGWSCPDCSVRDQPDSTPIDGSAASPPASDGGRPATRRDAPPCLPGHREG